MTLQTLLSLLIEPVVFGAILGVLCSLLIPAATRSFSRGLGGSGAAQAALDAVRSTRQRVALGVAIGALLALFGFLRAVGEATQVALLPLLRGPLLSAAFYGVLVSLFVPRSRPRVWSPAAAEEGARPTTAQRVALGVESGLIFLFVLYVQAVGWAVDLGWSFHLIGLGLGVVSMSALEYVGR